MNEEITLKNRHFELRFIEAKEVLVKVGLDAVIKFILQHFSNFLNI